MKSIDIYENIDAVEIINKIDTVINNISIDTRKIHDNDLYVGIKGENFDGNLHYMDAFNKGASIVIVSNIEKTPELMDYLKNNNKCLILVKDTVKALGSLAKYKRSIFTKPVVAITGSAGKTSTKDMIYSVLKEKYNAHKTIGNQNNHIGLPLTILSMEDDKDILVVEMGMNHLKEISYLTNIAKPNIAVITNVGTAHIGNLGSRQNILKAKLEILEGLDKDGTLIINLDNDLLNDWYKNNKDKYNIKTFSIDKKSDFKATNITEEENYSTFICNDELYRVPIGGEHFIYNALSAISVGSILNLNHEEIEKGINNFELSRNRMHIIENNDITVIDDCYNSNFDSLSYSIKYLGSLMGRKIACLGTMLELGEYSEDLHAKIGDVIPKEDIDILVTVGDYTELINERAVSNGLKKENSYHFNNNEDAIKLINKIKESDDKILVKASQALNFKEIVEKIQ